MTRSARAGGRSGPARLAAALLLGCALLLAGAGPASAHAQLISTDPTDGALLQTAPSQVTLTFDEPVRLTSQEISVYDAEGSPVAATARSTGAEVVIELDDPAAMGRGTFVVGWFVVSADGHPISGALTFSVGERSDTVADPPPPPTSSKVVTVTQGVVAGSMYAGLLVATGLVGFVVLVLPTSYAGERVRLRIRSTARIAAAVAIVAAMLSVPVAAIYAQGGELGDLPGALDPTLVRGEVLAQVTITLGLVVVLATLTDRAPDRRTRPLLLAGAALALLGPPLVGHTRSFDPSPLLIASDVVHLSAGATWLGGLVGLVLALRALAGREQLAAQTLGRFSAIAGGLLVVVAVTGSLLAWRVLGSWSAFLGTDYGRVLIVKICLALAVAALGGWNRFRMLPRVTAAAGFDDRGRASALVTRTVRTEAVVLVVLLGVSGFLVNQSPRPEPVEVPQGRTGVQDGRLSDVEALVLLTPRAQGPNTLLVQLQDETGELLITRRPPEVQLRSGALDLGSVPLTNTDAGTWSADVLLPQPGLWEVQVALRVSRFESPVTTVRFDVAETETAPDRG